MSLRELAIELRDYAGFGPGLVVTLIVSLVTFGYASRALGISRLLGWALVMSIGLVLSATITPSRDALLFGALGSGTCDVSRIGPASLWELGHLDDASLNILLFVPLGLAIGLCPRSAARNIVLAGAFLLPLAIESLQLVATSLGRACQSSDVFDNLTGLVLGIVVAGAARWVWSLRPDAIDTNDGEAHDQSA